MWSNIFRDENDETKRPPVSQTIRDAIKPDQDQRKRQQERQRGREYRKVHLRGSVSPPPTPPRVPSPTPPPTPVPDSDDEPMDDAPTDDADFAKKLGDLLRSNTAYTTADLYDDRGNRRSLPELLAMARYSSIWPLLSDIEKQQLSDTSSALAHARPYLSRPVIAAPPLRRASRYVVTSDGSRVDL
jgi:hypothetical protein